MPSMMDSVPRGGAGGPGRLSQGLRAGVTHPPVSSGAHILTPRGVLRILGAGAEPGWPWGVWDVG